MSKSSFTNLVDEAKRALSGSDQAEASGLFHRAAAAAQETGMQSERAYALRHAAIAELECGGFDEALADSKEALEIYASIEGPNSLNFANALRLNALANENLGHSRAAHEGWKSAQVIYRDKGIAEGVAECETHLAA